MRCAKIASGLLRKGKDTLQTSLALLSRSVVVAAFVLVAVFIPSAVRGQAGPDAGSQAEPLRVFLDCNSCDFDYLRREIGFVSYVRERKEADVHILVTTQPTGGGTEYVFKFIGLGRFANIDDELKYIARQTQTADERRSGRLAFHFVDDRALGAANIGDQTVGAHGVGAADDEFGDLLDRRAADHQVGLASRFGHFRLRHIDRTTGHGSGRWFAGSTHSDNSAR